MEGSILGYNETSDDGVIKADDGNRYNFTLADWRGERAPKAGDKVDFVAADGKATDVYPLKGSFTAPDLSDIGNKLGSAESRAEMLAAMQSNETVGLFLTRPHVAGAGLIILGWLVAGHLLLLFDVGKMMDAMGQMNKMGRAFGEGAEGIGLFRTLGVLTLLLFYLIPAAAGWLIYKSMNDKETSKDKRNAAIGGLVLPIAIPIVAFLLIFIGLPGPIREMIMGGGRQAMRSGMSLGDLIDIDLGWMLMIAGGVLIVLQMMGIVKSFGSSK